MRARELARTLAARSCRQTVQMTTTRRQRQRRKSLCVFVTIHSRRRPRMLDAAVCRLINGVRLLHERTLGIRHRRCRRKRRRQRRHSLGTQLFNAAKNSQN